MNIYLFVMLMVTFLSRGTRYFKPGACLAVPGSLPGIFPQHARTSIKVGYAVYEAPLSVSVFNNRVPGGSVTCFPMFGVAVLIDAVFKRGAGLAVSVSPCGEKRPDGLPTTITELHFVAVTVCVSVFDTVAVF